MCAFLFRRKISENSICLIYPQISKKPFINSPIFHIMVSRMTGQFSLKAVYKKHLNFGALYTPPSIPFGGMVTCSLPLWTFRSFTKIKLIDIKNMTGILKICCAPFQIIENSEHIIRFIWCWLQKQHVKSSTEEDNTMLILCIFNK